MHRFTRFCASCSGLALPGVALAALTVGLGAGAGTPERPGGLDDLKRQALGKLETQCIIERDSYRMLLRDRSDLWIACRHWARAQVR
jgi:hypothetical protein